MSQPLPIGEYKWIEFSDDDENAMNDLINMILNSSDDSEFGYILEVDLHYPESLHVAHNDFPFCAERSELPKQAYDIIGTNASKFPKLLLTLFDKEKYVLHYRIALQHGLEPQKSS